MLFETKHLGERNVKISGLMEIGILPFCLDFLEAEAKPHESVGEGEELQNSLNAEAPVHKSPIRNLSNPRQNVRLTEHRQQE